MTKTVSQIGLQGQVASDGMLHIDQRVALPPGPVCVTVQTAPPSTPHRGTLQTLRDIWAERDARGLKGRTKKEIDAEIDAMRDEDEEGMREIEAMRGPSQHED